MLNSYIFGDCIVKLSYQKYNLKNSMLYLYSFYQNQLSKTCSYLKIDSEHLYYN